jgi:hypothetical protein
MCTKLKDLSVPGRFSGAITQGSAPEKIETLKECVWARALHARAQSKDHQVTGPQKLVGEGGEGGTIRRDHGRVVRDELRGASNRDCRAARRLLISDTRS